MGNSRPLLRWIVRTCTASASDSSRRVRSSSPPSSTAARIRARSQPASAVVPRRSSTATRCRSWPTWRRSVMRRSPSTCSKTRSVSRSDVVMTSSSEATPRVRSTRAQPCRRRWTDSQVSSSASATRWADQPRNGVRAAAWARGPEVGRSSACRRSCHAFAPSLAKTLPAPLMTAGTPTRRSASCTSVAWVCLRTSTAMSPGPTRCVPVVSPDGERSSISASDDTTRTMSAATSSATCSRALWADALPCCVTVTAGWARWTTRMRSAASDGAPCSRRSRCAGTASTVR